MDFIEVDYVKDVLDYPLMKQFDINTKRFKNTPSEIKSIEDIDKQILELKEKIKNYKDDKSSIASYDLFCNIDGENDLKWDNIFDNDKKIEETNKKIDELNSIRKLNGIPPINTVYEQLDTINSDIVKKYNELSGKDKVFVNKLPVFSNYSKIFRINNSKEGYDHFIKTGNMKSLRNYIAKSSAIGMIFPNYAKTVLYSKEQNEK